MPSFKLFSFFCVKTREWGRDVRSLPSFWFPIFFTCHPLPLDSSWLDGTVESDMKERKKKLYILSWCCLKLYLNCQVFWRGRLVSLALPLIGHPALPHPWPHSLLPWEMCSPANISHLALFAALVVPTTPQFCLPWAHSVVGKWQVVLGEALSRLLNPLSSLVPQLWSDNWGQSQEVFTFSIYSTI